MFGNLQPVCVRCGVRIDGRKGGLIESEAFWININRDTMMPSRMSDDFLAQLRRTTDVDRLRWKPYLTPGARDDADQIREYPVRFTDIDLFDHMNNAVYWGVIEDYLSDTRELLGGPLRVTIEHEAPVAFGDKLEIIAHVHPAGSTDLFGPKLIDRTVTRLTYAVVDEAKAIASIFALYNRIGVGGEVSQARQGADVEFWTNEQRPILNKLPINHLLPYFVDGERSVLDRPPLQRPRRAVLNDVRGAWVS